MLRCDVTHILLLPNSLLWLTTHIVCRYTSTLRLVAQEVKAQGLYSASLSKSVSNTVNTQGKTFNYTLKVGNTALPGDTSSITTIYNVVVADNFPLGITPTKKHWIKGSQNSSSCTFSSPDSRNMRCSIGRLVADEQVELTVEVTADGKNFAGKTGVTEVVNNTATMTCAGNKTATAPDSSCNRSSTVTTTVSVANGERYHAWCCSLSSLFFSDPIAKEPRLGGS
jgi:hypothetical protein